MYCRYSVEHFKMLKIAVRHISFLRRPKNLPINSRINCIATVSLLVGDLTNRLLFRL